MILGVIIINVAMTHRSRNANRPEVYSAAVENCFRKLRPWPGVSFCSLVRHPQSKAISI